MAEIAADRINRPDSKAREYPTQVSEERFAREVDHVCTDCKPSHIHKGPHTGDTLPLGIRNAAMIDDIPCTTMACERGRTRFYRGMRLYQARRRREKREELERSNDESE